MTRTISNRSRLIETTVALSLLASLSLIGCGTDMSTAPAYVAIENDDGASEGQLPVPVKRDRSPAPIALKLVEISVNGAQLSWITTDSGLTAHIQLDGVEIATVNASDQGYADGLAKRPGMHTYGVCFETAKKKLGAMRFVEGEVTETPGENGRTDDRPEDGQ